MAPWLYDFLMIFIAGLLILVNGFFVAAEFGLVKIRESRIDKMVKERRPFASTGWYRRDFGARNPAQRGGNSRLADFDLSSVVRPPQYVPETMPVRRLLRQFQSTHQHLAFLVDEYGTISGIVTLDNILESIIGPVEDEFDDEQPEIVKEGPQVYLISGSTKWGDGVDFLLYSVFSI